MMIDKKIFLLIPLAMLSVLAGLAVARTDKPAETDNTAIATKRPMLLHEARPLSSGLYEAAYRICDKRSGGKSPEEGSIVAAVAPHHLLAADMIAELYSSLEETEADTVVLLGPNHFEPSSPVAVSSEYDWRTPYGDLPHDGELLDSLKREVPFLQVDEHIFVREHSINSHVAFIKKTFPQARFLPLVLSRKLKAKEAEELAKALFEVSKGKKILVISSVDFSHYKSSDEAIREDQRSLKALSSNDMAAVYKLDIDSPPSIYTMMRYAELRGGKWRMVANSNSALLSGHLDVRSTTSYVTGTYAIKKEE